MSLKSKQYGYIGESELHWHYEKIYKDQTYSYCFPKYKTIQETVKDRKGSNVISTKRIENRIPEWLKEMIKKSNNN